MKKLVKMFCGSVLFLGVSAFAYTAEEFKGQISFNGSSSLAPVISKISTNFVEKNGTWDKVNKDFPNEKIEIFVSSAGSGAGVKSVIEGVSDFGMVARQVKDSEKAKFKNYKEFVVASDALTISVNNENPILKYQKDISSETLKKIFSGEYKYWSDVDNRLEKKEIVVITRDLGGGAHEVFQTSIMGDTDVKMDAIQAPSMGALATKIVENKYAIGYASFGVYNLNKDKITAFTVDGVAPTEENILSGAYKIQRPLLFIKDGELTPAQKSFVDYIFSEEGVKAVEDGGYIPVK
ncbi:MAG: phosphate ABC transporter substrate-binding protein [Fusobacterium perfoetens]|uniref:phosphate ABC transporter substrate-binding protein n=1 Tax=Fusobacterium perfoetens TaxID=852 RepID=UPI0023F3F325|nr:phosphate ABC transporter substrate-binding protein [Fusobacterium perfoetens]MCI6152376.1 phosphate ABC transporter substrate-binding protein [Fusobacterium perfoetens]MDY3236975.1 phosphate ABC transporter substrate-binding protein [Fusobacterium perfoetens]